MTATAPPTVDAAERVHLARAAALAGSVRGSTAPNPAVGCVLLRDGEPVGEGATAPAGGPHAEVVALRAAGDRARGATAVVTLEPCDHHGRTPPCTQALIAAGVRRVVIGMPDPNPAAGGGAASLRSAGVEVVDAPAVFADWVAGDLAGFLTVVARGRPHVTLKVAQTADGSMRPPAGRRWITGPASRRAVHRWRAGVDAVLVGSGTVLADDPRLDVRDVPLGARPQPRPVILDARLRTPPTAQVVARGPLVVTAAGAASAAERSLTDAGAEVVEVPPAPGGGVELTAACATLADHGITTVLAEPGPTLAGALLSAGCVDRLVRHVALDLVADPADAAGSLAAPAHPALADAVSSASSGDAAGWRTVRLGGAGTDLIWERVRDDHVALVHPPEGG